MDMATGDAPGVSGVADECYELSLRHALAGDNKVFLVMRVESLSAIWVIDDKKVAEASVPAAVPDQKHSPVSGRKYRRTARSSQVHPVTSMNSLCFSAALDRAQEVAYKIG